MCCPYGSVPGPAVRSGPVCRRRRKERPRRVSSVNLAAAGLAAGCAHNKKLLEPCGCQESSADTCPLALREGICGYGELHRLNFNRLSVRHTAARGNGSGPELLRKAGRRLRRSEVEAVADLAGELAGIVPVRAAKAVGVVEEIARIVQILRGESDRESFA